MKLQGPSLFVKATNRTSNYCWLC